MKEQNSPELHRRGFIKLSSIYAFTALTGLSSLPIGPLFGQKRGMAKIIVGAHPWVYAAKQPNYDITPILEQIFADMQYAKMDGIELMHHPLRSDGATDRIKELSQKHQLPVIGTSYSEDFWDKDKHNQILEDLDKVTANLKSVGARTLGVTVGTPGQKKSAEQLDAQASLLGKTLAMCSERGIVPNLHNHTYEVENDMYDLRGTLERLPNMPLGPDLNWLVRGGVDPIAFLNEFGNKVVFMHIRDQHNDGKWSEALGEGDEDFKKLSKTIKKIKFSGDIVIELAHERDFSPTRPLKDSLKLSREHVRKIMGV